MVRVAVQGDWVHEGGRVAWCIYLCRVVIPVLSVFDVARKYSLLGRDDQPSKPEQLQGALVISAQPDHGIYPEKTTTGSTRM